MKRFTSIALAFAIAATSLGATADMSFAKSKKAYCKSYAREEADNYVGNGDVATGLVVGGGTGLAIGGLLKGNKGLLPGLAIGAVGGTMLGAISTAEKRKKIYKIAYNECMYN